MALSNSGALLAAATVDCIVTVWDLVNNADGKHLTNQKLIYRGGIGLLHIDFGLYIQFLK